MQNKKLYFLILFLLFSNVVLIAKEKKLEFTAKVDKNTISEDETLKLEVTLKFKGKQTPKIILPKFKDFKVIGRFQSQSINIIKGELEYVYKLTLLLLPKKTGTLLIPSIRAKIKFKELSTDPIKIKVKPQTEEEITFEEGISV